ncbi:MAG: isoaspartyl peptidase/L-asparaginase [Planctomycetota bacterium]
MSQSRPTVQHCTDRRIPLALLTAALLAACSAPGEGPSGAPSGAVSTSESRVQPGAATASSDLEVVDGVVLAIHGGAGTILRKNMTPETDAAYRAALEEALKAGYAVLAAGGSSLDAVEAAIAPMEDSPLFNAGRGAVLTDDGHAELDASIMSGANGMAGAIAGARTPRHPLAVARSVMETSPHVLLSGAGADRFAGERKHETMDPAWFVTPRRSEQLRKMKAKDDGASLDALGPDRKYGTVGCVAVDGEGHLAAGTSTGGMARKAWGRIGDSPLIGAGTWADDRTCAVSCTGHGEFFIRKAIAHQLHARMLWGGADLEAAARGAVLEDLPIGGGSGGCVALDADGRMVAPFTTPGMYRGWVDADGNVTVRIHGDER